MISNAKPVIDSIGDHLIIIDPDFKIIHDSGMCREMPTKSFIGSLCYKVYQKLSKPCPDCPVAKTFKDGGSHKTIKKLTAPNGNIIHIEVVSSPLRLASGEIVAGMEVVRNVTDRVLMEEELRKNKQELERRVQEKTQALSQAYTQLVQIEKMGIMGEMAASIAHEFGNPIFGIRNLMETLQQHKSLPKEERLLLGVAIDECGRLKQMIYKLQDMSRPDKGVPLVFDLHTTINQVTLLTKQLMLEKNISLALSYPKNMPVHVSAIEEQVKQVLLNLLKNAIEATPKKGRISISVAPDNGFVRTTVHNSGKSIDARTQENMFKAFYTTKKGKGTGLGLSVSNTIIKNHGGTLAVYSKPRRGTSLSFTLPAKGCVHKPDSRSPESFLRTATES